MSDVSGFKFQISFAAGWDPGERKPVSSEVPLSTALVRMNWGWRELKCHRFSLFLKKLRSYFGVTVPPFAVRH